VRPVSLWIGGLGAILGVLAFVLVLFGPGDWLGYLQLAAAAAGAGGIAVLGLVGERRARRTEDRGRRRLPDLSLPTVLLVVGVAMALDGLAFGLWLILIGLLVVALGVTALVRELADERREAR
jgi:hypothetical protein